MELKKNYFLSILLLASAITFSSGTLFAVEDEDFDDQDTEEVEQEDENEDEDDSDIQDDQDDQDEEDDEDEEPVKKSAKKKAQPSKKQSKEDDLFADEAADAGEKKEAENKSAEKAKPKKVTRKPVNPALGVWHAVKILAGTGASLSSLFLAFVLPKTIMVKLDEKNEAATNDKGQYILNGTTSPFLCYPMGITTLTAGIAAIKSGISGLNNDGILESLAGSNDEEDDDDE